jgi:hypothetical protein
MTLPYDEPVPYIPTIPVPVDETTGYPDPALTIDQTGVYGDAQQQTAKTAADTRHAERSQEGETGGTGTLGVGEQAAEGQENPPEAPQAASEGQPAP